MKNIVIVDYGLGNLFSINQAFLHFGYEPIISCNKEIILNADYLVLPGVGAFEGAMRQLNNLGLVEVLKEYVKSDKPIMGVCLGMQLLFEKSYEFGEHLGLGFIEGEILKFPSEVEKVKLRVPHIGWNKINSFDRNNWNHSPLIELKEGAMMYFVHSYYAKPSNENVILSTSIYNKFEFCSSVQKGNIYGFQFHPEKSGEEGLSIYKNFLKIK